MWGIEGVDRYNLSLVQQDVLFDQLHYFGSPKYNIGGYVSLGQIDEKKIKVAHEQVVLHNRMFHVAMRNTENGFYIELSEPNLQLPLVDFTNGIDPEHDVKAWIKKRFLEPFDINSSTLFYVALLKVAENKYYYFAKAHHLIVDGFGVRCWAEQLGKYYSGDAFEAESVHDFKSYFSQDSKYLSSNRYLKDKEFWSEYLKDRTLRFLQKEHMVHNSTSDTTKIASCSKRSRFKIDLNVFERLSNSSNIVSSNDHSLFVSIVAIYFSRAYQIDGLTIGVPGHNRNGHVHKRMIGLYTSVSPLYLSIDENSTFEHLVKFVQSEQKRIFRHQKYPIGHIVRDKGAYARDGLFDVGVNYLKLDNKFSFGDDNAEIRYVENEYQTTPFNLTVWNDGEGKALQIHIDYSLKHFTEYEIELIGARLIYMLDQVSQDPHMLLSNIDIYTPQELRTIEPKVSFKGVDPNVPFVQYFDKCVNKFPERVALKYRDREVCYRELDQLASQLAHALFNEIKPGDVVGIFLDRRPELVVGLLALQKIGAVYLPLDPTYPKSRIQYILSDSECKVILTVEKLAESLKSVDTKSKIIDFNTALNKMVNSNINSSNVFSRYQITPEDPAYVIYTSGSTGNPKGVRVSHRALSNFLQSMAIEPGFSKDDCLLAITPFSFDISILELLLPLMCGGSLHLYHQNLSSDIKQFIEVIETQGITVLQMTPSAWRILLASGWEGHSDLIALTGGESLPSHLAESLIPLVRELWNMYGPTETTIWSSCTRVKTPIQYNSIGKPIANTKFLILDNEKRILPIGIFGDLYIGGSGLANGYHFRPELTKARFLKINGERWYCTGDIARLHSDGDFEFQGRSDHQVKLNGYRIELGEVESVLNRHSDIIDSVVLIKKLEGGREALCAYYKSIDAIPDDSLMEHLTENLPEFMLPSFFIWINDFPKTPAGKIDTRSLPEPVFVSGQTNDLDPSELDSNTTSLLGLVGAHLQVSDISPTDNFFDIGANSTDVADLSSKINAELGLEISVVDMFSYPSVARLVSFLNGRSLELGQSQRSTRDIRSQQGRSRLQNRLKSRKLFNEA